MSRMEMAVTSILLSMPSRSTIIIIIFIGNITSLDGESNATGNDYVVNYMSGECYRAEKKEDKSFKLYAIEQPENGQE